MARYEQLSVGQLTIPQVSSLAGGSLLAVSLTPAQVAAATAAYQNVSVAGVAAGDAILCVDDPISNSTSLVSARCTTSGTLALQFVNPTAGALTPTAGTYRFLVIKTA